MNTTIRCPVFPTEDFDIILNALRNLFPTELFTRRSGERETWIEAKFSKRQSLDTVRTAIQEHRIIDAVKRVIMSTWTGTAFILKFDKQAAVRGKISIVDEDEDPPLGAIELYVYVPTDEDFEYFLDWFTPATKDGRIIRN